jgi:hypothetical protein
MHKKYVMISSVECTYGGMLRNQSPLPSRQILETPKISPGRQVINNIIISRDKYIKERAGGSNTFLDILLNGYIYSIEYSP